MSSDIDFAQFRASFPTTASKVYLNSGSYGLLSHSVQAAFERYLRDRLEKGADWETWAGMENLVRGRIAKLLGAQPAEIAVTASASAGMNAIASSIDFTKRRKAVVSNYEFPTSAQIWHAQEIRGARIVHVAEAVDRTIPIAHFEAAIDDETAIVTLSHVCYRHGAKLPADEIRQIAAIAHDRGALVILDCYQSVGTETISVHDLDVDFCVGGMLKYLLGTAGIGFAWVRGSLTTILQPGTTGWFAQANTHAMDIFAHDPSPDARRFQGGTPPVPSLYAAEAGLDMILDIGTARIGERIRMLTRRALDKLAAAGIDVATPDADSHRGPMIAIRSTDDNRLVAELMTRDIITSCRDGNVRAGFHAYNNEEDVDRFVEALVQSRLCVVRAGG